MMVARLLSRRTRGVKKTMDTTRMPRQPRSSLFPKLRQPLRDSTVHSSINCSPKGAARIPPRPWSSSTSSSSRERPSYHPESGLSRRPPNMGLALPRLRKSCLIKAPGSSKQISWRSSFRQRYSTVFQRSKPICSLLDLALAPSEERGALIKSQRNICFCSNFG